MFLQVDAIPSRACPRRRGEVCPPRALMRKHSFNRDLRGGATSIRQRHNTRARCPVAHCSLRNGDRGDGAGMVRGRTRPSPFEGDHRYGAPIVRRKPSRADLDARSSRRAARASRYPRRHARAPGDRVRVPEALRVQRIARVAYPARDHPRRTRRHACRCEREQRRPAHDGGNGSCCRPCGAKD